ncbi:hypothetical protein EIN_250760 [Entamoeba invadens IP1]|uniref:Uncharacterized protein n=1 Tax=Entamoeba invadens IP1 TaxID=370355 RepID=A0A0A1UH99_ENTIV|nr:hypothetical protein EIN_250760 [Entamoeba invadens IP1]ELP94952.1 hypothetical protein EIN_250760 [Entamoeba invadens IP1]|eukprot:XP_004261723.1 hypothetical protein EIN_250760 [Entamoeba invadens IP1]
MSLSSISDSSSRHSAPIWTDAEDETLRNNIKNTDKSMFCEMKYFMMLLKGISTKRIVDVKMRFNFIEFKNSNPTSTMSWEDFYILNKDTPPTKPTRSRSYSAERHRANSRHSSAGSSRTRTKSRPLSPSPSFDFKEESKGDNKSAISSSSKKHRSTSAETTKRRNERNLAPLTERSNTQINLKKRLQGTSEAPCSWISITPSSQDTCTNFSTLSYDTETPKVHNLSGIGPIGLAFDESLLDNNRTFIEEVRNKLVDGDKYIEMLETQVAGGNNPIDTMELFKGYVNSMVKLTSSINYRPLPTFFVDLLVIDKNSGALVFQQFQN